MLIEDTEDWMTSRYTRSLRIMGKGRILYNSLSGAIATFIPSEESQVRSLLVQGKLSEEKSELAAALHDAGFLVPKGTDELKLAQQLHQDLLASKAKHLIIMPTESCNFRCTYCYQSFPRGGMSRRTMDGLKAYIDQAADNMDHLTISWFGGEPLLAFDTIIELSNHFLLSCESNGISYYSDMSTNGYYLTKQRFMMLLDRKVNRFMVTLDGTEKVHNLRRKLVTGGGTFETILGNLKDLRSVEAPFTVDIRINFDEDNALEVPDLIKELAEIFGSDQRFQILVRPVGRWGGQDDERIPICDRTASDTHMWELMRNGLKRGMALSDTLTDSLMPTGSVCYAAKPNSLVIGAGGQLYKCSMALEEENNQVGQLHADGSVELDTDKIALWTTSGEEKDAVCQSCYYRPACQGNHCPLYRMRTGKRPCSHEKRKLKQVLHLIWGNEERGQKEVERDEIN